MDAARRANGRGSSAATLACRAKTGATSCIDRPLEAARLAVTERIADGANVYNGESFVRSDAVLALVIVTDEDEGGHVDAPAAPVSTYPGAFDAVKKDATRWSATVVARDASCPRQSTPHTAVRLAEFTKTIGARGSFTPICAPSLTTAMEHAFATAAAACATANPIR